MIHKKELEQWETKIGNSEVTPQAFAYSEILHKEDWAKGTNCYSSSV
jgi:hypothetical protein